MSLGRTTQSFFLFPTPPHEVFSTIANLKNTGPGLDNICVKHLKLVAHLVSDKLCHIINLMFKNGLFPSFLKKAKVIPVFIKGNKQTVTNYRRISILSCLRKVVEKLFVKRLYGYLSKFKLLKTANLVSA